MMDRNPHWDLHAVSRWLLAEGRFSEDLQALSAGLAAQLQQEGVPLWRLRLGIRTLHPLIAALSGTWERDAGVVSVPQAMHGLETRSSYIGSPLEIIQKTRRPFRRDLRGALGPEDHTVLHDLQARGATDYFGLTLRFTTSAPGGLMVLVTDHADGFSDHDITQFQHLADLLAPAAEIIRLKHDTRSITEAYLGPRTAARVLSGQITRGHVDTIRAAILFSDIRGWTAINTRLPPSKTVAIANRYFDILTDAVTAHNGEVLKLMGDGILAIFPEEDSPHACADALAAACAAQDAATADPDFQSRFGIAMHVGDVLYGNVGSATRLDFTVLGAAVNLTARLEGLCARYDTGILFSQAFAQQLETDVRHIGTEPLKGLRTPQPVFALP